MAKRRPKIWRRIANWLAALLVINAVASVTTVYLRWKWREQRYNQLIEQVAEEEGVDKFLIKAVMRQESAFDPNARSSKGAIGLMQVMPDTGSYWARRTRQRDYKPDALWNEKINVQAGTWYLGQSLAYWRVQGVDDPVPFALAAYNAGPGRAEKWRAPTAAEFIEKIDYPAVLYYIERVREFYEAYKADGKL